MISVRVPYFHSIRHMIIQVYTLLAKAAFNKKTLFISKLDLNLRHKLIKCHIWSVAV